ncbi:MAG TPA: choice-of-anchor P family protein [Polyangiaceae bacterium]|nr:choice-of-anchor P family protein [Polyangiaceae bacterium]
MMTSKLLHTGIFTVFAASLGIVGCASGDAGSSSSDQLQGDPAAQGSTAADPDSSPAKSFSGRAVAATVKVGKPNRLSDYSDNIFVSDTKPLSSKGGSLTASLATINAGNLVKAGVFNGSTHGVGDSTDSRASVANAVLFHGGPVGGLLGDVLGEDGHGGTAAIDLRQILSDLGVSDLVENLFGKGGPLEFGIHADVVEEDARAWCDHKGNAHSAAGVKILNLFVNGKPIRVTTAPNQGIDLGIIKIAINAQSKSDDGGTIDAAALEVNVADIVDVKVARASAGVTCSY